MRKTRRNRNQTKIVLPRLEILRTRKCKPPSFKSFFTVYECVCVSVPEGDLSYFRLNILKDKNDLMSLEMLSMVVESVGYLGADLTNDSSLFAATLTMSFVI